MDVSRLQAELSRIRGQIRVGNQSEILIWVIPGELACSQRPLRDHPQFGGSGKTLPPEARPEVEKWVKRIKTEGIQSIICLMHPKELRYYDSLNLAEEGLLGYYKKEGFCVVHLPWADPAHTKTPEERQRIQEQVERIRKEATAVFGNLPKPVLLHCSAAMDRTAPVAAFIVRKRGYRHDP